MEDHTGIFPVGNNLPNVDYQELYRAVIKQVIKDFYPFAILSEIPAFLHSDIIKSTISQLIHVVLKNNPSQLQQILYRIDISEKKLISVRAELTEAERHDVLVDMILLREAQKVWIRKKSADY